MEEKTYVADIDRTVYDIKDDEKDAYKLQAGLTCLLYTSDAADE